MTRDPETRIETDTPPRLSPRGLPVGVFHLTDQDPATGRERAVKLRVEGWPYFTMGAA